MKGPNQEIKKVRREQDSNTNSHNNGFAQDINTQKEFVFIDCPANDNTQFIIQNRTLV